MGTAAKITRHVSALLSDETAYLIMAIAHTPNRDGLAAIRIAEIFL